MSRKTTFEERVEIVEYVTSSHHSYSQTEEHYQVSYQQVRSWVIKSESQRLRGTPRSPWAQERHLKFKRSRPTKIEGS